jgi:hypothetical protein
VAVPGRTTAPTDLGADASTQPVETANSAAENTPGAANTVPERVTFQVPTVPPSPLVETDRFTYVVRGLPEPELLSPSDGGGVARPPGGGLKSPVNRQMILPVVGRL